MATRIVHESTTQRQHVRLRLPLIVRIGDREVQARDWSVAGMGLAELDPVPPVGATLPAVLVFDFGGYAFDLPVTAETVWSKPNGEAGFRFVDLDNRQIALLNYIVGASLSGEVVEAGDVLAIAKRENFTAPRKVAGGDDAAGSAFARAPRLLLLGVLWAIGLFLVGLIVYNAFTRAFVIEAAGVLTAPDARVLRAPQQGTVLSIGARPGTRVQPGQLLATISTADNQVAPVAADCDCIVAQSLAAADAFVPRGSPLVSLVPTEGRLVADFVVSIETAQQIRAGDRANVLVYDDGARQRIPGRVDRVILPTFAETNSFARIASGDLTLNGIVRVRFDDRQNVARLGQPVSARVNTFRLVG